MNKNTKSCLLLRLAIIEGAVSLNIHNELTDEEKKEIITNY